MNEYKVSQRAYRRILIPAILFALLLLIVSTLWLMMMRQLPILRNILFLMGLLGGGYGLVAGLVLYHDRASLTSHHVEWIHVVVVGISLGLVASAASSEMLFIAYILFVLNMISSSFLFSYRQVRALIIIAFLVLFHGYWEGARLVNVMDWLLILSFPFLAIIVAEIVWRFQGTVSDNFRRMNTLNAISRKLSSSLDEDEVHSWLKEAIQDAFNADSYYLGLVNGDKLDFGLFYDDGKYFHAVQVPMGGALSGWVIRNNKTLFLNDLRVEPELEGVKRRLIGQERSSLSWVGVPIKTEYVRGMIGIASYKPLAFTQDDVDLLESLTQQAALALNNARQHKLVTLQARTDSLTKVYNHGYFLERLQQDLGRASAENTILSLIMLDVDYFKKYNDTYGHLVGDEVLMLMVRTIRRFIKERDYIGRWGGEEFAISLPNTSLQEAQLVAVRIQETLEKIEISVLDQKNIPAPTVSQGIAEFPRDAGETFKLVDLADRRLYVAKERGRNQIEPNYEPDFANNMLC